MYFPTGSNLDDQRITDLSAEPEAKYLPFLAYVKQITFSLCPKSVNLCFMVNNTLSFYGITFYLFFILVAPRAKHSQMLEIRKKA